MIHESGDNWYYGAAGTYQPSISVIERPDESYDEYAARKAREDGAERVPFGFARALVKPKRRKRAKR